MDIKCYLPDSIGQQAKTQGVNFSALLREAVELELRRLNMLAAIDSEIVELDLIDQEGRPYTGVIEGRRLVEDAYGQVDVYLTTDDRLIAHHLHRDTCIEIEDPEQDLPEHLYTEVQFELGQKPRIRI